MAGPKRMPKDWHRFAHYTPYQVGNSQRGLRRAKAEGYKRADVDALMSADGVVVAAHWDRPLAHGWRDPLGKTKRNRLIRSMSLAHLKRLRCRQGVVIQTMWDMFKLAGELGLTVELDLKYDPRFADVARMRRLKAVADRHGCRVLVKTTSDLPGAAARLLAAKRAGFTTAVLPRGSRVLDRGVWWPAADYVRGPVVWRGTYNDGRYERVVVRGFRLDRWTAQALASAEHQYGSRFTLKQGSYNAGGVSASAGTHDGGGAVDLTTNDWDRAVSVLRQNGFAAWHRTPAQGPWGHHIHAILIGNERASAGAKRQVDAYRAGRNGLASNGPDDGPRVAVRVFPYVDERMP